MALSFEPYGPWHWLVLGLVLLAGLGLGARYWVDRWRCLGGRLLTRVAVLCLTGLAMLALLLAAWNPVQLPDQGDERNLVVLALDVSDSVLSAEGGWPRLRQQLVANLRRRIAAMPAQLRRNTRAEIVTFGSGANAASATHSLEELPGVLFSLDQGGFAGGSDSDLAAGLSTAAARIESAGGAGGVILVSDGNETRGDARLAARALAAAGIAIQAVPVECGSPRLGISALNLPEQVGSGSPTYVRGVLRNGAAEPVRARLELHRNAGLEGMGAPQGPSQTSVGEVEIADWARLHQAISFEGVGLQYADVVLAEGEVAHRRRLFTMVERPPQVLVLGGDMRWVQVVPSAVAELTQGQPEDLGVRYLLRDFDAVVLSGVAAERFREDRLMSLARAVRERGLGLFLINGHQTDPEKPTVLASYRDTPLAEVLPVIPGPRPYSPDPPPRQVVLMIDTSGSMAGSNLDKAKEIAIHVIANLLRPKDTLDILTFTTGVGHPVRSRQMDERGKDYAISAVHGLNAGGGTNPQLALSVLANRRMTDCGLIFISDGDFGDVSYRPDCRATVFAVGKSSIPDSSPLRVLADPFPVGDDFDPAQITIPFFNPEPRKRFWEDETFVPLTINRFQRPEDTIPMPSLELAGSAVSHSKSETDLVAVRPKLTDPILAFMDVGRGRSGVFCAELSTQWLNNSQSRGALPRWLQEIFGFSERDRYSIRVSDRGQTMSLRIAVLAKAGKLPAVDQLTVTLELEDGSSVSLPMRPDPLAPTSFEGQARVPRLAGAGQGMLRVREAGPDALARAQLIPFVVPPLGEISSALKGEALSQGIDEALLLELCELSAGRYDPDPDSPLLQHKAAVTAGTSLFHWLLLLALFCLLAAFALRRLEP